jgi:hypothetical protein
MTDTPTAEQLPVVEPEASNIVAFTFAQTNPVTWSGTATCPHGTTRNETFQIGMGVPPLNHAAMVESVYRQHELLLGCGCTRTSPSIVGTVTFTVPVSAVPPGQQRYIPQASAILTGPDLWWGPGLTVAKTGAYNVTSRIQLAGSVAQGALGSGVVVIAGQPVFTLPMTDSGGIATANIVTTLNINANQSIAIGYENTSSANQDVVLCSLAIKEVWVP